MQHIQCLWFLYHELIFSTITASAATNVGHVRLKAASAPHSGDCLQTPLIVFLGLTDNEIRISVALGLGITAYSTHNCLLRAWWCQRYSQLFVQEKPGKTTMSRHIKQHNLAHEEPTGLVFQEGKWPDRVTMIFWPRGVPLVLSVTVPDTCSWITHHFNVGKLDQRPSMQRQSKPPSTQILPPVHHPHLLPSRHWDRWLVWWPGGGANRGDWKMNNCGYRRPEWHEAPFPEDFYSKICN